MRVAYAIPLTEARKLLHAGGARVHAMMNVANKAPPHSAHAARDRFALAD
jgi:hypothetical protein